MKIRMLLLAGVFLAGFVVSGCCPKCMQRQQAQQAQSAGADEFK